MSLNSKRKEIPAWASYHPALEITHSGEDVPSWAEKRMSTSLAWLSSHEVIHHDGNVSHLRQPHPPLAFPMSRRNEAVGLGLVPADLG
jgi:hypothetical protein